MKATELRIGNLLKYCDNEVHVMGIGKNIGGDCAEFGYFIDSVGFTRNFDEDFPEPIPLTEEWLEKFGFKEEFYRGTRLLVKDKVRIDMTKSKFPTLQYWIRELEYVHSLQNLYFALTNTELKLKEHEVE